MRVSETAGGIPVALTGSSPTVDGALQPVAARRPLGRLNLEVRQSIPVWLHGLILLLSVLVGMAISVTILAGLGRRRVGHLPRVRALHLLRPARPEQRADPVRAADFRRLERGHGVPRQLLEHRHRGPVLLGGDLRHRDRDLGRRSAGPAHLPDVRGRVPGRLPVDRRAVAPEDQARGQRDHLDAAAELHRFPGRAQPGLRRLAGPQRALSAFGEVRPRWSSSLGWVGRRSTPAWCLPW